MVLTDGNAFGTTVYLGKYDSADNWREVTEEEAERMQSALAEAPAETEATEADYIEALERLGVNFDD